MPNAQHQTPTLSAAFLTDTGLVRKMNQDSVVVVSSDEMGGRLDGLYVVADGMGGMAGGEIASRVTVETVPAVIQEILAEEGAATPELLADALREALEAANDAVYKQARANPELRGMGTTCVAAMVRDGQAIIGNVGDSRIYLLRGGKLAQLTSDHSLVQEHVRSGEMTQDEARGSRFKNVITRAIGIARSVDPDIELVPLEAGDTLLLCSDGLTNMVAESEIARMLGTYDDAAVSCRRLVEAAKSNGGIDNITVVVVRHGTFVQMAAPAPDSASESVEVPSVLHRPPTTGRRQSSVVTVVLAVLVVLLAAALAAVGQEHYNLVGSWPFFQRKPLPQPAPPTAAQPPDYANLTYADPVLLFNKPVRGAPIVCDPDGNVIVISGQSNTVLRVTPDGKTSVFTSPDAIPTPPRTNKFWTVDPQGNLYVSSNEGKRITKYAPSGARIGSVGGGKLKSPRAIAVDRQGNLFVVDDTWLKVMRALAPGESAMRPSAGGTSDPGGRRNVEDEPRVSPSTPRRPNNSTIQDGPR